MVCGMTARLRLILAILVLALAPMLAPVAMAEPMTVQAAEPCDHACDGVSHSVTCAVSCALHAVMPPLAVTAAPTPPAGILRAAIPHQTLLSSARWPPPLRPPRS